MERTGLSLWGNSAPSGKNYRVKICIKVTTLLSESLCLSWRYSLAPVLRPRLLHSPHLPPHLPRTAPTPAPTPTQSAPPNRAAIAISPTPTATDPAAGLLAEAGKNVFVKYCSKCHGEKGEGLFAPTIIGRGSNLAKYGSARGLMDYITAVMPYDAPGSLTQQEYLQVLSFLLIQNGFIKPETIISSNQLQQIQLKK